MFSNHSRSALKHATFFLLSTILFWSQPCDADDFYVYSHLNARILKYDSLTGAYKGSLYQPPPVLDYFGMVQGPDGVVYVNCAEDERIHMYEPTNGDYLGLFTKGHPLDHNIVLQIGPDGYLYVVNRNGSNVVRYDLGTREFIDEFISKESGGIVQPRSIVWFDNNQYILLASSVNNNVLKYDASTGEFIEVFIPSDSPGMNIPRHMTVGPDGNLYVTSQGNESIERYALPSGEYLGAFVTHSSGGLTTPIYMEFGPDGNLYVCSRGTHEILRYNGDTGAFLDVFVSRGSGGLNGPAISLFVTSATPSNQPPNPPIAHFTPIHPTSSQNVTCVAEGSLDPEGATVTYTFHWSINGQFLPAVSGSVLNASYTKRDDLVSCRVTATDGVLSSSPVVVETVILNSPPIPPQVKILPHHPRPFDGLAVWFEEPGYDPDGDLVLYVFEWYEKENDQSDWNRRVELSGSLPPYYEKGEPEISHLYTQIGESWRVDVTAFDVPENETSYAVVDKDTTRALLPGAKDIGGTSSDWVTILSDLDGNDQEMGPDLFMFSLVWKRNQDQGDSTISEFFVEPGSDEEIMIDEDQLIELLRED